MKKLIFLTIILTSAIWSYGQTWVWPPLSAFNQTTGAPAIRATAKYAADRAADSIGKIYDARIKALEAIVSAFPKIDTTEFTVKNGIISPKEKLTAYKASNDSRVGSLETFRTGIIDRVTKVETTTAELKVQVGNIQTGITPAQLQAVVDKFDSFKQSILTWSKGLSL